MTVVLSGHRDHCNPRHRARRSLPGRRAPVLQRLTIEQRLALRSEEATRLLGAIAAVWPE